MKKTVIALAILFPWVAFACTPGDNAYLGSVCMMLTDYCPVGTLPMDGRHLRSSEHDSIYAVIGDIYGKSGDDFMLPDAREREVVAANYSHRYDSRSAIELGGKRGQDAVTLIDKNIPSIDASLKVSTISGSLAPSLEHHIGARSPTNKTPFLYVKNISSLKFTKIEGARMTWKNQTPAPIKTVPPQSVITYCIVTDGIFPW